MQISGDDLILSFPPIDSHNAMAMLRGVMPGLRLSLSSCSTSTTTTTAANLFRPTMTRQLCTASRTTTRDSKSFLHSYRLALGATSATLALALPAFKSSPLHCAGERPYASSGVANEATATADRNLQEAESMINVRDLGFGTVAGVCAGVFIKKGLKAIAFMLGGAFILLQYMSSRSFISVNWGALSSSYDSFITRKAGPPSNRGGNRAARVANTFVDFITANIQSRATFVAGLVLGLRLG